MRQTSDPNIEWAKWLGSAAMGALVMYMLDPDRGAPRRAVSGEKLRGLGKQTGDAFEKVVRSLGERASALGHERLAHGGSGSVDSTVSTSFSQEPDRPADTQHESASADTGERLQSRADGPLQAAGEILRPLLQASQGQWSTGTRSAAVLGGGALGVYALMNRSPMAVLAGLAGLTLLARGASNRPLRSLVATGRSRRVDIVKSIRIDASPEKVYDLWSNYENFPHFMSNVIEVRDLGDRRSHWVVKGPAGTEFGFNAILTEQDRPRRLAWRSEPGAEIDQSGSVEFQPARGGTRVRVYQSYIPPAGAVGRGIATLLGRDPEREMEEDLARMKYFIERGTVPPESTRQGGSHSRVLH
jgi:uncharacterized membrane protein